MRVFSKSIENKENIQYLTRFSIIWYLGKLKTTLENIFRKLKKLSLFRFTVNDLINFCDFH